MEQDTEPEIDYKTREEQNNNTYSFIIETEQGEKGQKGLSRFGKWEMRFVIANIGNTNTLTISCGITSIADDLPPKFLEQAQHMLYTEIAKYKQCVSIQYKRPERSPISFEIVVKCTDNENGFINYVVPVKDVSWTHSVFNVWIYDEAVEKIMAAFAWTKTKLEQLETRQLSTETAMRNVYFVDTRILTQKNLYSCLS